MNKLWFEQSLSDAVDKPRLHTQLVPDQNVSYEKIPFDTSKKYRMSPEILEGLKKTRARRNWRGIVCRGAGSIPRP